MADKPYPRTEFIGINRELRFTPKLYQQDCTKVIEVLTNSLRPVETVVQLGCGNIGLFRLLRRIASMKRCIFVDEDEGTILESRHKIQPFAADFLNPRQNPLTVELYHQQRLIQAQPVILQADALILINKFDKLDQEDIEVLPNEIFGKCQPGMVIVSIPNVDYSNALGLERKSNAKVFWTRQQFQDWSNNVCYRFPNYTISFEGTGPAPEGYEHLGSANQMAIFTRLYVEPQHRPRRLVDTYHLIHEREFPHQVERTLRELVSGALQWAAQKEIDSKKKIYKNVGGSTFIVIPLNKMMQSVAEYDIDLEDVLVILRFLGMFVFDDDVLIKDPYEDH